MVKFHQGLSTASIYLRYFHMVSLEARVAHDRLMQQCFIDYDREMALIAETQNTDSTQREIAAVGRLTKMGDAAEAEVAVLVTDKFQGEGLGTELVRRLIDVARDEKLNRVTADILFENEGMRALARHLDFHIEVCPSDPGTIVAALDLQSASAMPNTARMTV
jgi:acetyltransferase